MTPQLNAPALPSELLTMQQHVEQAVRDAFALAAPLAPQDAAKKPRVVSRMAKNVQIGDRIEMPDYGWQEVTGLSSSAGRVLFSAQGNRFASFGGNERVRTARADA